MTRYTPEQQRAITAERDTISRAGAGAGKTRMLTGRYQHLRQSGVSENQIVAVTFTDAAGQELTERFRKASGQFPEGSVIGTIHSLCRRIAQAHPAESGAPLGLQVMDDAAGDHWLMSHLSQALATLPPERLISLPSVLRLDWLRRLLQEPAQAMTALGASSQELQPATYAQTRQHQEHIQALREVFPQLACTLQDWRSAQGLATYADLEEWAARALQFDHVREYYAARWRYLLLDEAQDINAAQWEILQALWHPGMTLSIVGDAQQGIYGFRGADLRLFEEMRRAVLARGGEEIELSMSFRTDPQLIGVINQSVETLRAQRPSTAGTVPYMPLQAALPPAPQEPVFEVHLVQGERALGRARTEAQVLARRIRNLLDEGLPVFNAADSVWRPVRPSDIAILLRQRTYLSEYETALRREGIAAAAQKGRGLYQRPEVMDAAAMLRWLADPLDDLALLAILRGPYAGLSESEWLSLALQRWPSEALWETLQRCPPSRRGHLVGALRRLLEARPHHSAAGLLTLAQEVLGGMHAHAAQPDGAQRLANLQVFCAQLRSWASEGDRDVQRASARLSQMMEQGAAAPEAVSPEQDAVQLLTIHGAKGLEYGVVVIPDAHRTPGHVKPTLLLRPEGVGLTLFPGAAPLVDIKRAQQTQEEEEAERLHYVALTRAKHHLILSVQATPRQRASKLTLLQAYTAAGAQLHVHGGGGEATGVPSQLPLHGPFPEFGPMPKVIPTVYPVTALETYLSCPRRFEQRFVLGVRPLIRLSLPSDIEKGGKRSSSEIGQAVHHALQYDLTPQALQELYADWPEESLQEVIRLTQRFYDHPAFSDLQTREQREVPVQLSLGRLTLRGRVDAYNPSRRHIIDYKTDRKAEPQTHLLQVSLYAHHLGAQRVTLAYLQAGVAREFGADELQQGYLRAIDAGERIAKGHFEATPSVKVCHRCEARSTCPFKAADQQA